MEETVTVDPQSTASAVDPLGAASTDERVHAILTLTQRLTNLITAETDLLKKHRAAALRGTEAEKNQLSTLYAREMRAIQMRPELLAGATRKQKEMLRDSATAFKACVTKHVRTLARIRAVSEGLVVAIGEEMARMRQPVTTYSAPGRPSIKSAALVPQAPAFGFDRSI